MCLAAESRSRSVPVFAPQPRAFRDSLIPDASIMCLSRTNAKDTGRTRTLFFRGLRAHEWEESVYKHITWRVGLRVTEKTEQSWGLSVRGMGTDWGGLSEDTVMCKQVADHVREQSLQALEEGCFLAEQQPWQRWGDARGVRQPAGRQEGHRSWRSQEPALGGAETGAGSWGQVGSCRSERDRCDGRLAASFESGGVRQAADAEVV